MQNTRAVSNLHNIAISITLSQNMLLVQSLPSLASWHLQSVRSKQDLRWSPGPALTVQTLARGCCHVNLASHCHPHVSGCCMATTSAAESSDQAPAKLGPSPFDRLLAVSMYCLPLYEGVWRYATFPQPLQVNDGLPDCSGLYRLSVVCVRIAQYHTVNWLVWANRHGQELRSGSDQV